MNTLSRYSMESFGLPLKITSKYQQPCGLKCNTVQFSKDQYVNGMGMKTKCFLAVCIEKKMATSIKMSFVVNGSINLQLFKKVPSNN